MRLIDADALLTDRRMRMYYHLPNGDIAVPVIDIEHAPTIEERKTGMWIDVACPNCGCRIHIEPEIIRCKDCKYWEQESICDGYCSEIEKDGFDEDHFCSFAERRTDD